MALACRLKSLNPFKCCQAGAGGIAREVSPLVKHLYPKEKKVHP